MVVKLDGELEAALSEQAKRQGLTPQELVQSLLRERLLAATRLEPRD